LIKPEIIARRETSPILSKYIQVSRRHARFKKQNGDLFEDKSSLNGVFVNGNRVKLQIGDHIGFGVSGAAADCDGIVCSCVTRTVVEKIVVIDLDDDSPPITKTEPPDCLLGLNHHIIRLMEML
ncbi:putative helicase senataxin, partial [Trichonephila clavata]